MTTDQPTMDETKEKATGETRPVQKPAYVLAAEAADQADAEKREATERAAFVAAANPPKKKGEAKDGAEIHGSKPGFRTTGTNPNPLDDLGLGDSFNIDLTGKGWITCRDGKKIRDDGNSIFIPGGKLSIAQMEMVAQLAGEKGWTTLYAYKANGKDLHPEVTSMLSSVLAANQMPIQCCTSQKVAGKFRSHLTDAENAMRCAQLHRHEEAKKAAAPAAPAAPTPN
jgi:hypothetical protein